MDIKNVLGYYKNLPNYAKWFVIILCGLLPVIGFLLWKLTPVQLYEMVDDFGYQYSYIADENLPRLALFFSSCVLASLYFIAGTLEIWINNKHFENYMPAPPVSAHLLNLIVTVIIYTMVYYALFNPNVLIVLYLFLIIFDNLFRFYVADIVTGRLLLIKKGLTMEQFLGSKFEELYVYYARYPKWALAINRLLFTLVAMVFMQLSISKDNIYYEYLACIIMIFCILMNEIFSWGYRFRFINGMNK